MQTQDHIARIRSVTILSGERGAGKSCICLKLAAHLRAVRGPESVAGVVVLRRGSAEIGPGHERTGHADRAGSIEKAARAAPGEARSSYAGVPVPMERSALLLPSRLYLSLASVEGRGSPEEGMPRGNGAGRESAEALERPDTHGSAEDCNGEPVSGPRLGPYRFRADTIRAVNDLFRREIDAEAQDSRRPSGPHGGTARPARSVRILDEVGPLELRMGNGFLDALEALRRTPAVPALIVVRPSLVDEVRRLFPDRPVRIRWASRRTREAGAKALYEWVLAETPPD